jgi:transposase
VRACKLDFLKQIRQTIAAKGGSMGLNEILAWVNLGLLVVGFITLWVGIGRKLGSLQADFANGLKSIQAQMKSYGILLNILSTKKLFTSAEIQEINKPYQEFSHQDAINQLLNRIKAGNPISQDELERLKKYVARTAGGTAHQGRSP